MTDFRTRPDDYRHWRLSVDGRVATLAMDVDEQGGLRDDYELKLNSYDLGVDIELYDAIQRLRFEHPEVAAVVMTSAKDRSFCAGANIRMLAGSSHDHKVNFCKFTNETRNGIEDASACSGQTYIAAVNGACAGGGYELALACDEIVMIDDGSTAVSLPEVPLLAVLPGTGGLTRLADKRKVRRDRADFFCTLEEGIRGKRAVDWRLVDEVAPRSKFDDAVAARVAAAVARSDRPAEAKGIALTPLERRIDGDAIRYGHLTVEIDRAARTADFQIQGPDAAPPADAAG
ncbi:MAG: enoyl-CoA hydratase-related protein, partial [Alphaproteobacteria bacterium]|nr:enoyl-CoA hydratase-related protein [Alphaproteobacteria bacterium]